MNLPAAHYGLWLVVMAMAVGAVIVASDVTWALIEVLAGLAPKHTYAHPNARAG